jgi:CRP-like cAMP-binding protein
VNPEHLFEGTAADNAADMVAKGRHMHGDKHTSKLYPERLRPALGDANGSRTRPERMRRGIHHPRHRLIEQDVIWIRSNPSRLTQREMATLLGVDPSTVSDVVNRKSWRHL